MVILLLMSLLSSIANSSLVREPLVTVLMASFNRDIYLEQAIDSVINQTYSNWEFIIVDDASSNPKTLSILMHYMQVEPRIKVIQQFKHLGLVGAKNTGYFHSKGELIAMMDDDDLMHHDRLKR